MVILPKPISHNDKKSEESRNEFVANLERMMGDEEKKKKAVQNKVINSYSELPIKPTDIRKVENQRLNDKVE